jgi:hypothetical protein
MALAAPLTNEDFEVGTNQWSIYATAAGHQAVRAPEARHAGLFGLRMTDTIAGPETLAGPLLNWQVPQDAGVGPVYVRFWGRITGVDPSSSGVQFANIHRVDPLPSVLGVSFHEAQPSLDVEGNGYNTGGMLTSWSAGLQTPTFGQWELYEYRAKARPDDRVEYAVARDGVVLVEGVTPLLSLGRFSYAEVGLIYSFNDRFAGTFDVDDLRSSLAPMASRLAILAPAEWQVGACVPVFVRPVDSWDGGGVSADTSDPIIIASFFGAATVYSDLACSVLGAPELPVGSMGVAFSMMATAPANNVRVTVTTTDLVSGFLRVRFVDAGVDGGGAVDAGPDAGRSDGGAIDAGRPDSGPTDAGSLDAGTPDGGSADAGAPDGGLTSSDAGTSDAGRIDAGTVDGLDGGPGAPAAFAVGCGCASQTWFGAALALVALLTRRRTR